MKIAGTCGCPLTSGGLLEGVVVELLEALGVRVWKLPNFEEMSRYLPDERILLLDLALSEREVTEVIEATLPYLWVQPA